MAAYFCGFYGYTSMAKILLLETSTEVCSAAISVDGSVVALSETLDAPNHAALLTLQIEACAQRAGLKLGQLDALALSRGPGSYSSLRVGASVAKGICYALEKPLIAVDTLGALALATKAEFEGQAVVFAPMLDARRQEVWLALYDTDMRELAPAQPLIFENNSFEVFLQEKSGGQYPCRVVLSGNGMEKAIIGRVFENLVFSAIKKCSASFLLAAAERQFQAADFQDIAYFEPLYMKPPNITVPANRPF